MSNLTTELKSSLAEPTEKQTRFKSGVNHGKELHNRLLAYTLQKYHSKGEFPSVERASQDLGTSRKEVEKLWNSENFQKALKAQGIILREEGDELLTIEQLLVANELISSTNKRTVRQTLEVLEIKQATFEGWLRDPAFQKYLREKTEGILEASDYAAFRSLVKSVEAGDLNAVKYFFEMRGIYSPKITVDFNVEIMINKFVDIAVKYIKSDEDLIAFSKEVGELGAG